MTVQEPTKEPNRYASVLQPIKVGPVVLRNRVAVTGHTMLYGQGGVLSSRDIAYFGERAIGGAGLLITGQHSVENGRDAYAAGYHATGAGVRAGFEALGEAVHANGCRQFVQLYAAGSQASSTFGIDDWVPLMAPSGIPSALFRDIPKSMSLQEIRETVTKFALAAEVVSASGLDGVEIHGAHGYLIGQFLSRAFNLRDDQFGGDLRRRSALLVATGEAVRDRVGSKIAVGVRLSWSEHMGDVGISNAESTELLSYLAELKLFDYFNISGGNYQVGSYGWNGDFTMPGPTGTMADSLAAHFEYTKAAKNVLDGRAVVIGAGGVRTLARADDLVREERVDVVGMTRAHIADPHLVSKTLAGEEARVIHCIGVNECVSRLRGGRPVVCALNPITGREREWRELTPALSSRRILVIGGGPAGLRAAAVAAERGHSVQLLEAETLGGHLALMAFLPTREPWSTAIDDLTARAQAAGVEVEVGVRAGEEVIRELNPHHVIAATGAKFQFNRFSIMTPGSSPVVGESGVQLIGIRQAIREMMTAEHMLGRNVLVIAEGNDYMPWGFAELLSSKGTSVTVATPFGIADRVQADHRYILPRLMALGVRLLPGHYLAGLGDNCVSLRPVFGGRCVNYEVDSCILDGWLVPNRDLEPVFRNLSVSSEFVGDAIAPRTVSEVAYEAERVGRSV